MGTSSGANFNQQQQQPPPPKIPPLRQQLANPGLQTSLSLVSSDAGGSANIQEPVSNSEQVREYSSESASSQETWPTENNRTTEAAMELSGHGKKMAEKEEENNFRAQQAVIRKVASVDKISLRDVARDSLEIIAERMRGHAEELLDELKIELRVILEGTGGSQQRDEFLVLQKLVHGRGDLTAKSLVRAHKVQLEILVAINTGIQGFLHPNINLPHGNLIEIFVYKRCRNIACRNPLPADDCSCKICSTGRGFCNLCMCVICSTFDFDVNTCRWIGCDSCSHWTHTDCAIRDGQISMVPSLKRAGGSAEMVFRCRACNGTSELLGWVKDVFQHCAPGWNREALVRELDCVSRIFRGSEDSKGSKLSWKCEDLLDKLKNGVTESTACKVMLHFFQELDKESAKNPEAEDGGGRFIAPQEACNQIAEVVQEAVRKMEMVAEEKLRVFKKARLALDACDQELEDKAREVAELKMERQRKKQQIEELETIVRLKQAEADMFQLKASEARREAERLQRIALAKSEKAEEEYANTYLKLRLNEAEAEKNYLFEKIKLQESARAQQGGAGGGGDPSQMLMLCKIQDLLKTVYNVPQKPDGQSGGAAAAADNHPLGSMP